MGGAARLSLGVAGLYGAAGVALAAAAAHLGEALLGPASLMLLVHAAALAACAALLARVSSRLVALAAACLGFGTLLFSGSLAVHALAGQQPVPMAAPVGGFAMIAGWLVLSAAAVAMRQPPRDSDTQIR